MRPASMLATATLVLALVGCGGPQRKSGSAEPLLRPEPSGTGSATDAPAQIQEGFELFGAHCGACHGENGEGARAPAVIGPNALPLEPPASAKKRTARFRSARDVFMWVREHMPADAPGSLTDDQYLAIIAFDLKANGIALDRPLDPTSAEAILLHP